MTETNLRFPAVFCENLRSSATIHLPSLDDFGVGRWSGKIQFRLWEGAQARMGVFVANGQTSRVPPGVGLAPSAAWRDLPLRPFAPPAYTLGPIAPARRLQKKAGGGWGNREREGGKGWSLRERSANAKQHLGPDPHFGALENIVER